LDPWINFLMSDRPFGRFDRLVPFSPPLFLWRPVDRGGNQLDISLRLGRQVGGRPWGWALTRERRIRWSKPVYVGLPCCIAFSYVGSCVTSPPTQRQRAAVIRCSRRTP